MDSPAPFSQQPTPAADSQARKQEQFELLSLYLDGETTADEQLKVEAWLATDPEFKKLHQQLLTLQQRFQQSDCPLSVPSEILAQRVFSQASPKPRTLLAWSGVGAVAAAAIVGVVSNVFPGVFSPIPLVQTAAADLNPAPINSPTTTALRNSTASLMLSLDEPPIAIPAAQPVVNSTSAPNSPSGY